MILLLALLEVISDDPCPAFNEQVGVELEVCIGPAYSKYAADDFKRYETYGGDPGSCPPEDTNNQSCFCSYSYDIALDFPDVFCSGPNVTAASLSWSDIIDDVNKKYFVGSQYTCNDIDYPLCVGLDPFDRETGKCYKSPAVMSLPPEQTAVGDDPGAYFMKGTERASNGCNCYNREVDWKVVTTDFDQLQDNLWANRRNQDKPLNSTSPGSIALAGYSWVGFAPNEFDSDYITNVTLHSPVNLMIPRGSPVDVTVTELKGTLVEDPILNRTVPCGVIEPRPFGSVTLNTICKATTPNIEEKTKNFGILEAANALCSITREQDSVSYLGMFPSGDGDELLHVINTLDEPETLARGLLTVALIKYFETHPNWPEGEPSFHGSKKFPGVQPPDNHIGTLADKSINIFEQGMYSFGTSVVDYGKMVNQMAELKNEENTIIGNVNTSVLYGDWSLVQNNTKSNIGRTSKVNFSYFSGSESRFISQLPPFMGKTTLIGAKSSTLNCVDDNILRQCLDQHIGPDKPVPTACSYYANPFSVERLCDGARLADKSLRDMFADTDRWIKTTDNIEWDAPSGIIVQNRTVDVENIMAGSSSVPSSNGGVTCKEEKNVVQNATSFGSVNEALTNCSKNNDCFVVQANGNSTYTFFSSCDTREFTSDQKQKIFYMKSNYDIQLLPPAMTCQEEPSYGIYASNSNADGVIFMLSGNTFSGDKENITVDACRRACHSLPKCQAWRHISIEGWKNYSNSQTYTSNQCLLYNSCNYAIIVPEPFFYSPEGFQPVPSQNSTDNSGPLVKVHSEVLVALVPLWDLAPFSPNAGSDPEPNVGSYLNNHHDPLNTNCAADYGSDQPCCENNGTGTVAEAFQCPEDHPICTSYKFDQQWGNCVSNETTHFTTFPLSVWLSDVASQYYNYLELADPLLFQTGVLAEAYALLHTDYGCSFPDDNNVYGVLHDNNDFVISKTDDSLDNLCQTIEFPGNGLSDLPTKLSENESLPFDDYNDAARDLYDGPLFVVSFGSINGSIVGVETEAYLSYAVAAAITMQLNQSWIDDKVTKPEYDLGEDWWQNNYMGNLSAVNLTTALLDKIYKINTSEASVNAHTDGYTYPYGCGVFQFIGSDFAFSDLAGGVSAVVNCSQDTSKCYQLYYSDVPSSGCQQTFSQIVNQEIDRTCGLNATNNRTEIVTTYAQMGPKSFLFGVPPEPSSLLNETLFADLPDYKDLYIHSDVRVICHDVWTPSFWYNNIGNQVSQVKTFNGAPIAECNVIVQSSNKTIFVPLPVPTAPFKKVLPFIYWITWDGNYGNDCTVDRNWCCPLLGGFAISYTLDGVINEQYFPKEQILNSWSSEVDSNGGYQCSGYLDVNIFYDKGTTPEFICGVSNQGDRYANVCPQDNGFYGQVPLYSLFNGTVIPAVNSEFNLPYNFTTGFDCTTLPAKTICGMAEPSDIPGNGTNMAGFAQDITSIIPSLRHIPDLEYATSKTNTEHLFGGARRTRTDQTGISEFCTPANLGGGTSLSDGGSGGFTYRQRYFVNFPFPCTKNSTGHDCPSTDRSAFTPETPSNNILLRGPQDKVFVESPGTIVWNKVYSVPMVCQECGTGSKITASYGTETNIYLPPFPSIDIQSYSIGTPGPGRSVLGGQKDGMYFFVPTNIKINRMLGKLGESIRTEKQQYLNPFEDWGYSIDQLTRGCQGVQNEDNCTERRECIWDDGACNLRTEGPDCFGGTAENCSHPHYPVCVWINITASKTALRLGGGFAVVNDTNKFTEACVPITWKRPLTKETLAGMVEEGTILPSPTDTNNTDILGAISTCGNNPSCIVSEPWFVYGRAFINGFSTNYTGEPYWDTVNGRLMSSDTLSKNTIAKGGTPVYNMSCDSATDSDSCSILVDFITDLECPSNPAGQWSGSCIKPSLQLALPNQTKQAYIAGTYLVDYFIPEEKECPVGDGIRDSEVWLTGIEFFSGFSDSYKFLEDINFCQTMGLPEAKGNMLPFCVNNGMTPTGRRDMCNEQSATLQATGYVLPSLTDQHKLCIEYTESGTDKAHCFYLPGSITRIQTIIDDYADYDLTIDILPFTADFFSSLLFCPEVEETMYTNQVAPDNNNFTNISPEQMPFVANQSIYSDDLCIAELFTSYTPENISSIRDKMKNLVEHLDGNPIVDLNDYDPYNPLIWESPAFVEDIKIIERRNHLTIQSAVDTYPVTWYQDIACLLISISDSDHVTIKNIVIHLRDSCLGQGFYSVPIRLSGTGAKYATIDIEVNLDNVVNAEVVPTALGIVGSILFSAALRKSIIDISGLNATIITTHTNMVGAIIVNAESVGHSQTPNILTNAEEVLILQSDNITTNTTLVDLEDFLKPLVKNTKTPPSLDILIIIAIVILCILLASFLFVFFDIIQ